MGPPQKLLALSGRTLPTHVIRGFIVSSLAQLCECVDKEISTKFTLTASSPRHLSGLDLPSLEDVSVPSFDQLSEGTEGFSIDLEKKAIPLEAGVNHEHGQLYHHVTRVAACVGVEFRLQAMDQLAVIGDVQRLLLVLVLPHVSTSQRSLVQDNVPFDMS